MTSIKYTETEKNLLKSFAGESQATNRYTFFAKKAKEEGLEQIAAIFKETAMNEMEHAKRFFNFLEGNMLEITATYPAGNVGTTLENLKASADGENEEWSNLYPKFATTANKEGLKEIAATYTLIAKVEQAHENRYRKLYENLKNGKIFEKNEKTTWKCRICGYLHEGKNAPIKCPVCLKPQAYFEMKKENY